MEKRLLLEMTLMGINYLAARGINMQKVADMQKARLGQNLTVDDLLKMENWSQAAIDSIDVKSSSLSSPE